MRTLGLEHAKSIVAGAEDYFTRRAMDSNYFIPFKHSGAADRPEALFAILLAIAEYRQALPQNDATARLEFETYVRHCESVVLHIILDSGAPANERAECEKIESIASFINFLDSTELYSASFWDNVYQRIGLHQPDAPSKSKPWWKVW